MPFIVKLLIFWIIVAVVVFLLKRFPNSQISQIAFSWHGPVPNDKETLSHYMLRWAFYAFKLAIILILLIVAGVYLGDKINPNIFENTYFQLCFLFGFPILCGMAVLGGVDGASP